jgi:ADP-heptose:LPS heptosyltransferase
MAGADLSQTNSFLVIRLGAIGDVLRVLPAVRRLRLARPQSTIGWVIEEWAYPIIADNPNIDRFHIFDRSELRRGGIGALKEIRRIYREITACRYEVSLDFHGRAKSGLFSLFSGAKHRIGYGFRQSTEANFIFNNRHVLLDDPDKNRVARFLNLLEPLGVDKTYDPYDHGIYMPPEIELQATQWHERQGRPILAAYPGSSKRQADYHRWPPGKWIDLLKQLGSRNISSVVFWGPDEEELARTIVQAVGPSCSLAPTTSLKEMLAMLKCFEAFIGSNTAAMHMAWMQNVPTIVFVGPATPSRDAPPPPFLSVALQSYEHVIPGRRKREQAGATTAVSVAQAEEAVCALLSDPLRKSSNGYI